MSATQLVKEQAKARLERADERQLPSHLRQRRAEPAAAGLRMFEEAVREVDRDPEDLMQRLARDRRSIIPWLDRTRPLEGCQIIEVGCGAGASTVALAEQGAQVIGVEVDGCQVELAQILLDSFQLQASFVVANANQLVAKLEDRVPIGTADWVVFWAALEHMTYSERQCALVQAWALLKPGGLLTTIETPNRLWYYDSHTALLPFYYWLEDELAFDYRASAGEKASTIGTGIAPRTRCWRSAAEGEG